MLSFHPSIPLFAAAFACLFLKGVQRKILVVLGPLFSLFFLYKIHLIHPDVSLTWSLPFTHLMPIRLDALSHVFALILILFTLLANIYALHLKNRFFFAISGFYAACSVGAVLAGDLLTLFIFWELMAVFSAYLIYNPQRTGSLAALFRYFLIHLIGGLFFFSGLMIKVVSGSTLAFTDLSMDMAGVLIFMGFILNAGLPPLHAWLPDAYPEGTPEGSVFLSCFTSKVAVYALARGFAGSEVLIILGAVAAVYGVIYALMENDMRKLLSYHIICQIGYIVIGIGLGSAAGISAGAAHAVGNILFKGLLFMATGALVHLTGCYKLSELGGMAKRQKLLLFFYMVGALSISGLPLLNGYISKSMLLYAAHKSHQDWLEPILLVVAAGTFMSITLKLAYFAFFHKQEVTAQKNPIPRNMFVAMAGAALLCFLTGSFPNTLIYFLPYGFEHFHAFSLKHVVHTLQMLGCAFLGFLLIKNGLHVKEAITLDLDWFYRKASFVFIRFICTPLSQAHGALQTSLSLWVKNMGEGIVKLTPKQTIREVGRPLLFILQGATAIAFLMMLL